MVKKFFTPKHSLLVALATLAMMLTAQGSFAYSYTALSGSGGEGRGEGYQKLVDGDMKTKWGQGFNSETDVAYVIFKSDRAIVPSNYCLIIGNDTQTSPGRNWQSWNIYAANFESDEEATKDASGWVLVDKKENEIISTVNYDAVDLTCSESISEAYRYFKIEVLATVDVSTYMQMSEFSWGTSSDFFNNGPISYVVLAGDRFDNSGEGLPKLFDGQHNTKWGNGQTDGVPQHAIFKTTRPVAPSYYCLVTGNDNARWNHRNWRDWEIWAMNTDNESEVTRESDKWVLIDKREGVTEEELPDYNSYEVFFTPNQEIAEAYTYFKIEIYAIMSGGGYMQMCEFYFGDAGSLESDAQKHYDRVAMDLSKPMQKSLAEEYGAKVQAILSAPDIFTIDRLTKECQEAQAAVKNSINAYDSYINVVNQLRNHYENHTCITGEGRTIVGNYLETNAEPSDTYPNGTYAYIIENGLLDVDGINNEGIFVNMMLEKYASDLTEGAIETTYEALDGAAGFANESFYNLVDGNDQSKWCSNAGDYWVAFRADEPIIPTYYRLVTGNDTGGNPDRNWRSWKVYGANFADDDACERDATDWVLLDEKNGIGNDQLPAANFATAFFYMSNPSATPYQYFKIEISDPTGLMQMGEFSFGNGANFILTRQEFYEEFAEQDPSDAIACKKYIEDYKKALNKMQTTASIIELSNLYNTLSDLLNQIATSEERYEAFEFAVTDLRYATSYMTPELADYWGAFLDDDIEPGDDYQYGSYKYIMENLQIENAELAAFTSYLNDIVKAALEGGFCVVSGNMDNWGEGENYFKLVDKDRETKWGGAVQSGGSYVIFYSMEPTQPLFYKLTTGNDTEAYYGRNWKNWQIYGGNFEKDADATVDADGWVLLDDRVNIGQDRLPAANFYTVPFGFTEGVDTEYKYFKVVVTAAYDGASIQMSELEFGTEDELEEIRQSYIDEIEGMSIEDVIACDSLINVYYDAQDDIYMSDDIEQIYLDYQTMLLNYDKIQTSAAVYEQYQEKVAAMKETLGTYDESEELNTLKSYLNEEVAAGDVFPNGSAATVVAEHLLNNDELLAEIDFMNSLATAALLKGYAAGADITAMVANPSFGDGAEGWDGEIFASSYNEEYTMSAAEFCNEQSKFDVSQTLTGLKNGYYLVGMNGGFRPANNIYSTNYAPVLYANDNVTYIKAVRDDMVPVEEAIDRVNSWQGSPYADLPFMSDEGEGSDTLGFVLHGVQSCCYAFLGGRYQNYVVAKVTDGTLTFGAKNEGTQAGGDWTGLGNTTVKFLGELDSEAAAAALDLALDCEGVIVDALNVYEGFYETADYKTKPFVNEAALKTLKANMASAPATGAAKYDVIVSNSECFKQIYEAKNAYVKSVEAMMAVQNKWDSHVELMAEADKKAYDDAMWAILDGSMGLYTAEAALKAADDIKVAYPCYIDLDPAKSKGSLEIVETAPFEYELQADGNHPNIGLNKVMYDAPLADDQYILAFEYKCETELEDGLLYLAHPSLNTNDVVTYGKLPAENAWKKAYILIANDFGWGTSTDHWMRWDLAASGTFDISVRNMIIVTEGQMEAEGGEVLNPNSIDSMIIDSNDSDARIYNVMGQRVNENAKGIIIKGGKKLFNK
ncbi:MAG: hypothetical protein J5698_01825 [Bacteroidaceae bacterium]|nr:hypothetical protein [Bacteroidaceae bacterium]